MSTAVWACLHGDNSDQIMTLPFGLVAIGGCIATVIIILIASRRL